MIKYLNKYMSKRNPHMYLICRFISFQLHNTKYRDTEISNINNNFQDSKKYHDNMPQLGHTLSI